MTVSQVVFPIAGYLIGSIPFGVLISRGVAEIDITSRGSGNIGATNVARELGIRWGLVTLLLDLLKGFIPLFLYYRYVNADFGLEHQILCLTTLLGHQFPLFLKFHGGKGVATALGIIIAISPLAAGIALLIFILSVYISDFVSLGSMIAACSMPLILLFLSESKDPAIVSLIMAAMICLKHKDNIKRLIEGKENRWRKRAIR